jgi:hypothetical protein
LLAPALSTHHCRERLEMAGKKTTDSRFALPGALRTGCVLTLLPALTCGCASTPPLSKRDAADANDVGQTVGARTATERALLERAATLPSNQPSRVGDVTVVAQPPYASASGRTCRSLQVTQPPASQERLVCQDGNAWVFVPDVFVGDLKTD